MSEQRVALGARASLVLLVVSCISLLLYLSEHRAAFGSILSWFSGR